MNLDNSNINSSPEHFKETGRTKVVILCFILIGLALFILGIFLFSYINRNTTKLSINEIQEDNNSQNEVETNTDTNEVESIQASALDTTKLPLGDSKYTTTPKVGYIYTCRTSFDGPGGGAFETGPWIDAVNKTWNLVLKATVSGHVEWSNRTWSISSDGSTRILSGNGFPDHYTGIYPIQSSDIAYKYDRNPNSILEQSLSYNLSANPTILSEPECIGGEVGIMLSGIPLFDGFDADGRDAVANEVQDECSGHPQVSGEYHYHGNSNCIEDTHSEINGHSDLIGYALDGFGIYGRTGENGVEVSTNDLDVCHGHTHKITWDGKEVEMYHYHITLDFPYSVSCFRGDPINIQQMQGGMEGLAPTGPGPQRPPRR
jgi:hypothetical protein